MNDIVIYVKGGKCSGANGCGLSDMHLCCTCCTLAPVQVSLRTHPKFVSLFAKKTHPICGLLLGGSRKGAVQLWLRKQRIYANAQQASGRPATEAKGRLRSFHVADDIWRFA